MKKLFLTLFFVLSLTGLATAGDQDFTLVNKTGVAIGELFVSPASADDWGTDVLGVDILEDGDEVAIHFSRNEDAAFWDLMVKDLGIWKLHFYRFRRD
jgi:hypothetical protein